MAEADQVMFEVYREADYGRLFRVVYFTELDEHNKESEINRAIAGDHFYDGFIPERGKERYKRAIEEFVARLNNGEELTGDGLHTMLEELA